MAPGPGRSAEASTSPLPVAAMQNTEASVAGAGVPVVTAPAGTPFSVMVRHAVLPKQPTVCWLVQNAPVAFVSLAVPVVSGVRLTEITPTCEPSQQLPPPAVQGQASAAQPPLPGPPGHGVAGLPTPPVGQSRVTPVELVVVQAIPARGPRSQVPVPGLLGEPVAEHFGHGWARLPVRYTSEFSGTFVDDAPLARSSVPLAAALQVFSTQVVSVGSEGFGIGSGVPKLHPTSVQSGPAVLTGGMVEVGPIVQLEPVQLSANWLVEPSGIGPSGTRSAPPPRLRPPQVRFLMRALLPSSVVPQGPPGVLVLKSSSVGGAPGRVVVVVPPLMVVVVVLVVVDVVVVLGVVVVVLVVVVVGGVAPNAVCQASASC